MSDDAVLAVCESLALQAGRAVMRIFEAGCAVEEKSDSSPVTVADRDSETIILTGLRDRFPKVPCVAEEEIAAGIVPVDLGREFFLVDPLDGTKEFVSGRTDFTVNIALVRDGAPEIGVVLAPHRRRLFSGRPGRAEVVELGDNFAIVARTPISVRVAASPLTVVASRSHKTPETETFIKELGAAEVVSVGSSLKFCLLASAEADVYPRFGRTMEWDTAAGDAVLRAAGGMTRTLDGKLLVYGKRGQPHDADFANLNFIARGR